MNDRSQIQLAFNIASEAHAGQKRKNGVPYIKHPFDVFFTLQSNGVTDPDVLSAAILHDVKEDCDPSFWDRIVAEMPQKTVDFVLCVTDPERSFGNRKARKEQSIKQRLQHCETVVISLADKKSNLIDIPGVENKFLFEAYMPEADYAMARFYDDRIDPCFAKNNDRCVYCHASSKLSREIDAIIDSYYADTQMNETNFIRRFPVYGS